MEIDGARTELAGMANVRAIGVVGLGLVGGSVVQALRQAGWSGTVRVHDPFIDASARHAAAAWVDEWAADDLGLLQRCDLLLLCQPAPALLDWIARASAHPPTTLPRAIIDVCGIKAAVVAALQAQRAANPAALALTACLVPCHPVAGNEGQGWAAADARLFLGRRCLVAPAPFTNPQALALALACWRMLGAEVEPMDACQHDEVMAAVSHGPQLLTWAYLEALSRHPRAAHCRAHAGPGFASFTRLGASNPALWADLALLNGTALLNELDRLLPVLGTLRRALESGNREALAAGFEAARAYHLQPLPVASTTGRSNHPIEQSQE